MHAGTWMKRRRLRLNQYFLLEMPPLKPTMTCAEPSAGTMCVQVCAIIESSIEKACLIKSKEWKEKCNQRDAWPRQRLAFTVPTQKLSLINTGFWRRNEGNSFCLFVCSPNGPRISHNTFGWLVYSCQVAYCVNRRIKISEETALPGLTLPPPRLYLSSCPPSDFSPSDPHLLLWNKRKQTGTPQMTQPAAVGRACRKCTQKSVATHCDRWRIRMKKGEEIMH